MKRMIAIAAAAASLVTATLAWAGQQDFTIVNHTGRIIMTLNVSPSDQTSWGPDILGRDVLGNNESSEITFDRDEERCLWDIRVTYQGGGTGDWRQINLCETTEIELT